ncbi:hypothetical protein ACH5AL_38550 [Actinacidiphila glaucinigra]
MFLPVGWDEPEAADRRASCGIPEDERHRPKWQLASWPLANCGPRC